MELVYCDTCVYIDLFLGRKDRLRDLGEFALNFFRKVDKQYTLVTSDWVYDELRKTMGQTKTLEDLHAQFKVIRINRTTDDEKAARKLSSNYTDALHVVLALRANAKILTTQNIQHFAEFQELIEIVPPECL